MFLDDVEYMINYETNKKRITPNSIAWQNTAIKRYTQEINSLYNDSYNLNYALHDEIKNTLEYVGRTHKGLEKTINDLYNEG